MVMPYLHTAAQVSLRAALLGAVFALAVLPAAAQAPAAAQGQPAAADSGVLEEVVVTARRQTESLQRVPIAISAFNPEALNRQQAADLGGLQGAVPNLNIVQGRGTTSSANTFIRGIGQPDALVSFDPGVGIYVDDVFVSRIQGALFDLYDLERVEVLRGPQGTLYGKNTIGGAIKLVSKKPTDELSARIEATIGSYERLDFKAGVSGPIIGDKLLGSVSVLSANRNGYFRDTRNSQRYNDKDSVAARASLLAKPSDRLEILLTADVNHERPSIAVGEQRSPLTLAFAPTVVVYRPPGTPFDFKGSVSVQDINKLDSRSQTGTITWNATDALTLKSITAYRSLNTNAFIDIDATPLIFGDVRVAVDQNQLSQEFQALFDNGGPIKGVAGLYYLRERINQQQFSFNNDWIAGFGSRATDILRTKSYAAFANATWEIVDRLSLSGGIRYTDEKKSYRRSQTSGSTVFAFLPITTVNLANSDSWNNWSPRASLDYRVTDDVLAYASVSRGFKSGGFNGRAANQAQFQPYDPELVWTYEAGLKATALDDRLRANAAVFYNDYTNFQASVNERLPDNTIQQYVVNAGKLKTQGFELEVSARPLQGLDITASLGYLDAKYKEFFELSGTGARVDLKSNKPAFSPKWTAQLAAYYRFGLTNRLNLTVGGDVTHRSSHYLSVRNTPLLFQKSYEVLNAQIILSDALDVWRIAAGVKNIDDKRYLVDAQDFAAVGGARTGYYGAPRTYSLTVSYRY
jgi:iron complex outermembrane receptor protein